VWRGGALPEPGGEGCAAPLLPGEEPPVRRRQQADRGGALPLVPGEERRPLQARREQTHRRQRARGHDAVDRGEQAGRTRGARARARQPDQSEESMKRAWPMVKLGAVLRYTPRPVTPAFDRTYREIGIRSHGRGIFHKPSTTGADIGGKKVFAIE